MSQPIPKKVQASNPILCNKTFNTLLIDGSNLLEVCFSADRTLSSSGKQVGGIFSFFVQLKLLLKKGNFRYVYVFWDGDQSGIERAKLYSQYKMNRDKNYDIDICDGEKSDYMKEVDARIKSMQNYFFNKKDPKKSAEKQKEKEIFYWQRSVIIDCLEELFIRQVLCDEIEADDFIGYYVTHKKPNERIVIVSNDRDLTQLISDDVIVYVQSMKDFLTKKNHTAVMGYNYKNVVLKKVLCGDSSDNIKGIKGLGETTLLKNFPEFKEREVLLEEVVDKARQINEDRAKNKKKPLKWAENIVNRITDGVQGDKIYEINEKIIDLRHPLMNDEAVELIDGMMYSPIDPENRTLSNLYDIFLKNGVDSFRDENHFSNFFTDFMYVIEKERKNEPI